MTELFDWNPEPADPDEPEAQPLWRAKEWPQVRFYIVCYDIRTTDKAGRRRLARVAKFLERYGQRVQKSVFELRMNPGSLAAVRACLLDMIDARVDSLRIYEADDERPGSAQHYGAKPSEDFLGTALIF
jgi:CRISPR-associated protein Cas2